MTYSLWVLLGMIGGLTNIGLVRLSARRGGWRRERLGWVVTLACVAGAYIPFALSDGEVADVGVEILGAALYLSACWLGATRNAWWLVLGWWMHPVWDLFMHTGHAPFALAPFCLGWDPVVGTYLAYRIYRQSEAFPKEATEGTALG